MEDHFKSAESTRETMQQLTESQTEKLKRTMLHQTVREMATKSLSKGRGVQHLVYAVKTLGVYLQLKFDAVSQWRKSVFPRETVRRMELRKSGKQVSDLTDTQIQHLRKEQLFLISENQNIMALINTLQQQLIDGTKKRSPDTITVHGQLDTEVLNYTVEVWNRIMRYRQLLAVRFAFSQLKLNDGMLRDVENGFLEPPTTSKESKKGAALDVSGAVRGDTMDKRSLAFKFCQQRAAVHLFTSMHSRRTVALAGAFHKLKQIPDGFWVRTVGFCAECKENHPRGQHSRYRQSLYMRDEQATQKALEHVLNGPTVPYRGVAPMAMEGKFGEGRQGPAPTSKPPYFGAGEGSIPVMKSRMSMPTATLKK